MKSAVTAFFALGSHARRAAPRALLAAVVCLCSCMAAAAAGPARGQQVLFAPSMVSMTGVDQWSMLIHGRIFKPPEDSRRRQLLVDALAGSVGAPRHDALYRSRAGYFVSDSIRNMRVSVTLGERVVELTPSDPAGYFAAELPLSGAEVARLARAGVIAFESAPTAANAARFRGGAVVVPQEGITVVTDMDDTIKDTQIRNRNEAKANTFVRPFKAVAGMPELYRAWQAADAAVHFHVVSAGPWQFHEPLRRFTEEAGFPAFTWDMRSVDLPRPDVVMRETVHADPRRLYDFKVRAIRALMLRLPQRRFVLVGDSGEQDPEVYATILSQFSQRVMAVYIRDVSGEDAASPRYQKLYGDAAAAKLRLFTQPDELPRRLGAGR